MTLRVEYSLRQALPIALSGLPLLSLEHLLSIAILDDLVFADKGGLWLYSLICLPVLAVLTFALCFQRFSTEYKPPLGQTHVASFQIFARLFVVTFALVVLASGWPLNVYHWARIGIVCSGLTLGMFPFKWIYFDWLTRRYSDTTCLRKVRGHQLPRRRPISSTDTA